MFFSTLFPLLLLGLGIYIGAKLRFFCFLHPLKCAKALFAKPKACGEKASYSPWKALTVALAGTLGVGNITGVAAAILLGGSGSLFWMWASALLTMLIKYAEVVLAVATREKRSVNNKTEYHGGPARYLPLLAHGGSFLSAIFSILCIVASFVQGNLIQTGAVAACMEDSFSLPILPVALSMTALSACLVLGGRSRIAAFTEKMIPLMTALYLVMGLTVIVRNLDMLPSVFGDIFQNAFSFRAAGGGFAGSAMALAMRHGAAKGVFSHEAGCGTSPISHAGAETDSAHRQGLLGIAEVSIDALLLCTVTGLVLLLSGVGYHSSDQNYTTVVLDAFSVWFGESAAVLLSVSIAFYAFATLICWSFYGSECVHALCKKERTARHMQSLYLLAFCLCTCFGAFLDAAALWVWSDILTISMTAINTCAVACLLDTVIKETKKAIP